MKLKPVKLIQVGMGGWGRNWARLLAEHPEVAEIVAHVDIVPTMLDIFHEETATPRSRMYATLLDALEATAAEGIEVDGVLVTTALEGHLPIVMAALEAGKHVLVEKPFGPSVAEAQVVVDRAAELGLVLAVSQNYRFYPAPQAVAKIVQSGELGPVSSVTLHFRKYANGAATSNHYHIRQPLLMDMSIHHFDLMRYVLGQDPTTVYCKAWNPVWSKFDEPGEAVGVISFDGGAVVDYHGSWVSTDKPTTWGGEWRIECAEGVIEWTSRNDSTTEADAVTVRRRGKRAQKIALPPMPWFDRVGSTAAFAEAIQKGTQPMISGNDNLKSIGLMFAMVDSAESGAPVVLGQGA